MQSNVVNGLAKAKRRWTEKKEARERRQLIPHVCFQVPFLGPESEVKSGFACAGLLYICFCIWPCWVLSVCGLLEKRHFWLGEVHVKTIYLLIISVFAFSFSYCKGLCHSVWMWNARGKLWQEAKQLRVRRGERWADWRKGATCIGCSFHHPRGIQPCRTTKAALEQICAAFWNRSGGWAWRRKSPLVSRLQDPLSPPMTRPPPKPLQSDHSDPTKPLSRWCPLPR